MSTDKNTSADDALAELRGELSKLQGEVNKLRNALGTLENRGKVTAASEALADLQSELGNLKQGVARLKEAQQATQKAAKATEDAGHATSTLADSVDRLLKAIYGTDLTGLTNPSDRIARLSASPKVTSRGLQSILVIQAHVLSQDMRKATNRLDGLDASLDEDRRKSQKQFKMLEGKLREDISRRLEKIGVELRVTRGQVDTLDRNIEGYERKINALERGVRKAQHDSEIEDAMRQEMRALRERVTTLEEGDSIDKVLPGAAPQPEGRYSDGKYE